MEIEHRLRIFRALTQNPNWVNVLTEALEVEKKKTEEYKKLGYGEYLGFQWWEVHTPVPTLHKMVTEKLLDITLSTRSGTHFKIRDPFLIEEAIRALEMTPEEKEKEIPQDIFNHIVGYEKVKVLLKWGIESEKPAHFLLSGVPASSKSLFLMELARLPDSCYCLAPTLTSAGLSELLFIVQPKFLLIDEIDRLSPDNLGTLNSLMAFGVISETKYRKTRSMNLGTKVFAAGIRVEILPKDLLSRFIKLKFPPYIREEFIRVSISVLQDEGADKEVASLIPSLLWDQYQGEVDIRTVVQVFRLGGNDKEKIREVLQVLKKYGPK